MPDDKTDEWYDKVTGMADDLELTGKERDAYVHDHMTAKGYRTVRSYVKADDDEEQPTRRKFGTGRDQGKRRRDEDDDW